MSLSPVLRLTVCASLLGTGGSAPAQEARHVAPPLLTIGELRHPPDIDGEIVAGQWAGAAQVTGFINISTGRVAAPPSVAWLGFDADGLYVAVRCFLPRGSSPRAAMTGRDAAVWQDDSVELYLNPADRPSFQGIVSAAGVMWDRRGAEPAWDGEWRAAARILDDRYEVEMAVPWSDLGLAGPPEELRFNLCRNVTVPDAQWTALAWTGDKYGTEARFGTLRLGRGAPVISITELGDFAAADIRVNTRMTRPPARGSAKVLTETFRPGGVMAGDQRLDYSRPDSPDAVWRHQELDAGVYILRLSMWDPQGTLCTRLEWPFEVQPALRLAVSRSLNADKTELRLDVTRRARGVAEDAPRALARLVDVDGQVARESVPVPFRDDNATLILPLTDLPVARYNLRVIALDTEGNEVVRSEAPLYVAGPPVWLGTREGLGEGVPAPWTPPQVEGRTVRVWGREYDFGDGPVPRQVLSRGEALLAAPAALLINGAPGDWEFRGAEAVGIGPESVRLRWDGTGPAAGLTATTEVMFEGMVRVDVTIPGGGSLDSLAFEMPVKRERAMYLHDTPGQWGTVQNTRLTPSTPQAWPVKDFVWLLDDDRGICWFQGMLRPWRLARPVQEPACDRVPM